MAMIQFTLDFGISGNITQLDGLLQILRSF